MIVDREGPPGTEETGKKLQAGHRAVQQRALPSVPGRTGSERNKAAATGLPHSPSAQGEKGHGAEAGIQAINPLFKE